MTDDLEAALGALAPVSLAALNDKAAMMERLDNKYVVEVAVLVAALEQMAGDFDVLEIGAKRRFTYATCYFDDPERRAYFDHHQGRRRRAKVRVRRYVDAGLGYLEVKLKDRRGVTVKKRCDHRGDPRMLTPEGVGFVEDCWRSLYGDAFGRPLAPVLEMEYRRATLVARAGGERMTIDTGLTFRGEDGALSVPAGIAILETKSERANGLADKVLRALHQHPTDRCSKYCVGMAVTGQVPRWNRFRPALKRLGLEPAVGAG